MHTLLRQLHTHCLSNVAFQCSSAPQTCSNICGVVVLIMAVYAGTARPFFSPHITTSGQSQTMSTSNVFISTLRRYAKYLRRVIMGWIGEESINLDHVVSSSFLRPALAHSQSTVIKRRQMTTPQRQWDGTLYSKKSGKGRQN